VANVVVEAQYVADTTRYVRSLRQASEETARFAREIPEAVQATDKLKASSIGLSAALGTVGAIIGAKAIGAIQKYAMQGIAAAKQYEQTVISIEGIFAGTGMSMEAAAEKTKTYLADLRDFAAKTPFELPQVLDAVKRLLSIGYAADDVKNRMLPAVGDIVAALGQPPHAVSAVVYAFGQMKSAGRVLSQDLMQIGNALPGFNAKMALASKLFQGDMFALTKAMESGALDSTKAIDAIIEAMTEFGGAQGAMARQSQTLVGVMSTFADTVNNALIDGLMPSLPVLSATLNQVMPEVQALATAFAQALGPALIDGATSLGKLAPIFTEVLPPIIEMAGQLTALSDVIVSLAPLLEFMAAGVGLLAQGLGALPAPIYAALAALLVLQKAGGRVGFTLAAMNAKVISGFALLRGASAATSVQMTGSFAAIGNAAVASMGRTARAVNVAIVGMRSAAIAAKGLMASLGPVGLAIIGASVAFEILGNKSADAERIVSDLKQTVDETTGAFTELTAAAISKELRSQFSPEDIAALEQYGISVASMTQALMQGGDAATGMQARIDSLADSTRQNPLTMFTQEADALRKAYVAFDEVMAGTIETRKQVEDGAKAAADAELLASLAAKDSAMAARNGSVEEVKALAEKRKAFMAMSADEQSAMLKSAATAAITAKARAKADETLAAAQKALETAFAKTQGAFEKLTGVLSEEASMDAARAAVDDLSKSLKENGTTMSSHTEKGRANRAAVRDVVQSYVDWAKSAKDPMEQQRRLMEGERELRKTLGKKYDKLKVTEAFEEARDTTAKYAQEWGKAADDAQKAGNDVGYQFVKGIIEGLEANKNALEAAGAAAAGDVEAGAAGPKGFDTGSPSKKGIKLGKEFIDGLVLGLDQMGLLKGKGASLGSGLTAAVRDAIKSGGSVSDMLSGMLGGLPSLPTPLEMALGGPDKVEKWKKKHEKQLMELTRMAANLDKVLGHLRKSQEAFKDIQSAYDRGEFTILGEDGGRQKMSSAILDAFGSKGDINSTIAMYKQLSDSVKTYYNELIAAAQAAGRVKRANSLIGDRDRELEYLRTQTQRIIDLRSQIQHANTALEREMERHASAMDAINAKYDALIAQAEAAIRGIEAKYDRIIAGLEKQLEAANQAFDRENQILQSLISARDGFLKQISDGFNSFARDMSLSEGDVLANMADRLKRIKQFTSDIRALASAGLNQDMLREIIEAGPDRGAGMATALLAGGPEAIAQVNEMQSQLGAEISAFKEFASQQYYDLAIAQQQAIVEPLALSVASLQQQIANANAARASEIAAQQAHIAALQQMRAEALAEEQRQHNENMKAIKKLLEQLTTDLDTAAQDIQGHFELLGVTLPMTMTGVANLAVNSFIAQLGARSGDVYTAALALGNAMKKGVADALQANSPSKVMIEMGNDVAAGLIIGMRESIPMVEAASRSMAEAAMPGMSDFDYTGAAGGGGGVVIGPGAVQINLTGSMDSLDAGEIQRIVDQSLMNLAREIRRT
jgi:hypothetical protein